MSTKIEWCEETWNPITGCTPISEGCAHCYAKRMAENRLRGRFGYPQDDPFRPGVFHRDKLDQPSHWKKPRKIFVCSMGDLFHEDVPGSVINQVWLEAFNNPRHIFIFLTKRPEIMARWTEYKANATNWPGEDIWPDWMWIGVTAENQKRYDERVEYLLSIPAAVHFLSAEPLLGQVDARDHLKGPHFPNKIVKPMSVPVEYMPVNGIDWVIVGGETGPGARQTKAGWVYDIRDQCIKANVPFFYKGHGTHAGLNKKDPNYRKITGREYNEFPEVSDE